MMLKPAGPVEAGVGAALAPAAARMVVKKVEDFIFDSGWGFECNCGMYEYR